MEVDIVEPFDKKDTFDIASPKENALIKDGPTERKEVKKAFLIGN